MKGLFRYYMERSFYLLRDPKTGLMFEQGPVKINIKEEIIGIESFRTHNVKEEYDTEYSHPLLSEFILDLAKIYQEYGDGYLYTNNEMTPELFGKITVRDKSIDGLPSMNGETQRIRYFDIDEIIK